MCGIIGFIGKAGEGEWRQTHSILRELFLAAEHRGQDATGFVAVTERSKSLIVAKEPLTARRFVRTVPAFRNLRDRRCSAFVGHVRLATHGEPSDRLNNHPHVGKSLSLVHNGVVSNHLELADRHSLHLKSHCDSEVLLRLIEASSNPALGLSRCLREVSGSMAVAVFDAKERLIWLARNSGRPLWLIRLNDDGRVFFASTAVILLQALQTVMGRSVQKRIQLLMPIPADCPIALAVSGQIIAPLIEVD